MTDNLESDADVGLGPAAASTAVSPKITSAPQPGLESDADVGLAPSAAIEGSSGATTPDATWASTVAAPGVGFNRLIKGVLAAPGDIEGWAESKLTGDESMRGMGSRAAGALMASPTKAGLPNFDPDAPQNVPRGRLESALQAGGEGAASMILPEGALAGASAAGIKMAPQVGEFLTSAFGKSETGGALAKSAAIGMGAGATGNVASQAVDPNEHPYWAAGLNLAGSLVGGGVGAIATADNPWAMVKSFTAPVRTEGQEQLAGEKLRANSTDVQANIKALENPPDKLNNLSPLLTSQVTNDTKLSGLERVVQTQPGQQAVFNDVRAQQNADRVAALGQVQPTGSPEDVSAGFRDLANQIEAQGAATVKAKLATARTAATKVGGMEAPEVYGSQIANEVNPQIDAATQNAADLTNNLGGVRNPNNYGAAMREAVVEQKGETKDAASGLYKALNPDGSLNAVVVPLRESAENAKAALSDAAKPPSGEEAAIMGHMTDMPDVVPFSDLQALDARVGAAMKEERRQNGETPAWGRLTQMKQATQDAIDNAVANQVAYERSQVSQGAMSPEDTFEARLIQEQKNFYATRDAAANSGTGDVQGAASRPSANAGRNGAVSSPRGGPAEDEGAEGVPEETLTPNMTPEAAGILGKAKEAWGKYKQTYANGPIAKMLKTNGYGGQFTMQDSNVPDIAFGKGKAGYDNAIAYRNAVKDDPAAIAAAHDYAAMTLRRMAEKDDGTLDPKAFSNWREAYGDALRAYPEIMPAFSTAAKASEAAQKFLPFKADMAPHKIPEVFFAPGAGGAEGVANLRRLIGDKKADEILSGYAASKLRDRWLQKDGTIDPEGVERFKKAYGPALESFPKLNRKFSSAANATKAVGDAAAAAKESLDQFQAGAVGKIMNAAPADVSRHVGAIFATKDAAGTMARLAAAARDAGPAAVQGLRKAIADHIQYNLMSNTEAGTSGVNLIKADQFQTFIRKNRAALSQVFNPDEIANMELIAEHLHRTNRSLTAAKIPGSPGTAAELTGVAAMAHKPPGSALQAMLIGAAGGYEVHGLKGALIGGAGGALTHILQTARAAGYSKVDGLVRDALLDPELALQLMRKAPVNVAKAGEPSMSQKMMRIGALSVANQAGLNRAQGGRIDVNANPTELQKIVGNYKKHHMRLHGLDITIENPKGSYRKGVGSDGKPWRVKMPNHYGYIRNSVGADGDHVDAYIGPHEKSDKVFVVDQKNIETGKFDEHKAMIGFRNREAAIGGYCSGFSDGKGCKRLMKITPMTVDEFKTWLSSGQTREPIGRAA